MTSLLLIAPSPLGCVHPERIPLNRLSYLSVLWHQLPWSSWKHQLQITLPTSPPHGKLGKLYTNNGYENCVNLPNRALVRYVTAQLMLLIHYLQSYVFTDAWCCDGGDGGCQTGPVWGLLDLLFWTQDLPPMLPVLPSNQRVYFHKDHIRPHTHHRFSTHGNHVDS